MSMFMVSEVRDYTSHSAPGRCSEKAQPYPMSLFVKLKSILQRHLRLKTPTSKVDNGLNL